MSEHSFDSAPDMGREFSDSSRESHEMPLEVDAQNWEPTEEAHLEEPSEKHLQMHYTPGGALEQEVHTELDDAARKRIIEAQRQQQTARDLPDEQELDFAGDFDEARRNAMGWDPESRREYESLTEEYNASYDNDVFETGRRFEREHDREWGRDDFEH